MYLLHDSRYYIKVLKAEYNYIKKKKKYAFSPYEKKVVKRRKKKESPMKTDPDEMYDLFCSGEGRGEREYKRGNRKSSPRITSFV